jgi:hypothetical protein
MAHEARKTLACGESPVNRQQRRRQERELKKMQEQEAAPQGVNVGVCIPTHDNVPAYFAYDLAQMLSYTARFYNQPGVIDVLSLHMVKGTYVHSARMGLAAECLKNNVDWLLFLDSDMRFPKDTLVRLLSHGKAFVGTNYPRRGIPPKWVAIKKTVTTDEDGNKVPGELLITTPESTGLEEVEALGFGCVILHRSVFDAMVQIHQPKEKGYFWMFEWDKDAQTHIGEDVFFCRLAREAGATVYVDHDLSKELKHIGQLEFGAEHSWSFYAEEERLNGEGNQLHDATLGSGGHTEPLGSDGDDSGDGSEGREPAPAGQASEAAG